jgi:hypothetical protein
MARTKKQIAQDLRTAASTPKKKDRDKLLQSIADEFDPPAPVALSELPDWEMVSTSRGLIAISPSGSIYKSWAESNTEGISVDGIIHPWIM